MGALLGYELARKIAASSHPKPDQLFLSGMNPPHIKDEAKMYHLLPDDEFKKKILNIGGTPPEVFEHQELLEIFIPLLRADFRILETYKFIIDNSVLDCPITLFYGAGDEEVASQTMNEWQRYTRSSCQLHQYEGGHFFINVQMEAIVEMINGILVNTITL
jgi:medium-chain acyl-[acyl-carrier-protein] hydrolase